ncbi:LOW QUALITY PROTEIN: hypothetical protein LguiA_022149 [Lonicera macranthoides]
MQELLQLVLQKSEDGIDSKIKQTFLSPSSHLLWRHADVSAQSIPPSCTQRDLTKFDWPLEYFFKIDQINAVSSHNRGSIPSVPSFHPRAAHNLLRYPCTRTSFSKRDMNSTWLRPEWTFWQKEALFKKYRIENIHHNRIHELRLKNREKTLHPTPAPVGQDNIGCQSNYLDIPWVELTKKEKSHFRVRANLAVTVAKGSKQPIPDFLNKNSLDRFLSFNAVLRGEKPHVLLKKKTKSKSKKEVGPDLDQSLIRRPHRLVDQPTDSKKSRVSTSGRQSHESEKTESELDIMPINKFVANL